MITQEYKNKIYNYLLNELQMGEVIDLNINNPVYNDFVEATKSFIDEEAGFLNDFDIEFNQDYTKVRKIRVPMEFLTELKNVS